MAKRKPTRARKQPTQDRSRYLVETLLETTRRLLVQEGWETLSTNQVAQRAGVSVGSLYQYFPNREALLGELARRHLDQMGDAVQAAFADVAALSLPDGVKRLLEVVFATLARQPILGVEDARRAYEERCKKLIKSYLVSKRSQLRGDLDEELAAWFVVHQSIGVIERFLTDPVAATSTRIIEEMTFAVTTYLSGRPKNQS
jgi:AcrR family transcriptional regulator